MEDNPTLELIQKDFRGSSWSITLPDGREAVLIFSKKGIYRGGHSHDRPEISLMLTGKVRYKRRFPDGREEYFTHKEGEPLFNEPGVVHLAYFLEDSWLLDWKIDTKKLEAKTTNYPPYRAYVDQQMEEHKSV